MEVHDGDGRETITPRQKLNYWVVVLDALPRKVSLFNPFLFSRSCFQKLIYLLVSDIFDSFSLGKHRLRLVSFIFSVPLGSRGA